LTHLNFLVARALFAFESRSVKVFFFCLFSIPFPNRLLSFTRLPLGWALLVPLPQFSTFSVSGVLRGLCLAAVVKDPFSPYLAVYFAFSASAPLVILVVSFFHLFIALHACGNAWVDSGLRKFFSLQTPLF